MTAGRLKLLGAGDKAPKSPAFALEFAGGSKLVLTENAKKKRAGVWLLTPEPAAQELAHLGPEALGLGAAALARSCSGVAPPARASPRPDGDRGHRPGLGERDPPRGQAVAVRAVDASSTDEETERLAAAIDSELGRGLELRERGASDERTYRVHRKLGEPCHVCGTPIAQVDFEEHTIFYCPSCQTGGRVLKDRRLSRLLRRVRPWRRSRT